MARSASTRPRRSGFQTIRLRFELDSDATEEQLATLYKLTERYCVVFQTLAKPPTHGVQANGMSANKPESSDLTHTTLSVLLLALLIASSFWVLSPFLMAMLWATIVSVAAWPFFLRLEAALGGRRKLAVAIVTVILLLVIFVPLLLALMTIVTNAGGITAELRSLESIQVPEATEVGGGASAGRREDRHALERTCRADAGATLGRADAVPAVRAAVVRLEGRRRRRACWCSSC